MQFRSALGRFLLRRLFQTLPVLALVAVGVFVLLEMAEGDAGRCLSCRDWCRGRRVRSRTEGAVRARREPRDEVLDLYNSTVAVGPWSVGGVSQGRRRGDLGKVAEHLVDDGVGNPAFCINGRFAGRHRRPAPRWRNGRDDHIGSARSERYTGVLARSAWHHSLCSETSLAAHRRI